jgi:RNA polymerase-binding transcription factor
VVTKTKTAGTERLYCEFRKKLENHRHELLHEVEGKIRAARTESKDGDVFDEVESSDVGIQEAIGFALIQMKAETLRKIDAALRRLGENTYGRCLECGDEIAAARLRALPFATRCRNCEDGREAAEQRERILALRRGSSAFFFDMSS